MASRGTPEQYFSSTSEPGEGQQTRVVYVPYAEPAPGGSDTTKLVIFGIVALAFFGVVVYAMSRK